MFSKSGLNGAIVGLASLFLSALAQEEEHVHHVYSRSLKFNNDGTFKIVTFSDLGLNESSEDYLQTQELIEKVLASESPDLVVLTGDIVDPAHADDFDYHFSSALELIKARQVPWVWTGGNKIKGLDNARLHEIDYSYGMSLSWTGYFWDMHQEDPKGKTYEQENLGYFTARIPIMDPAGKHEILSVYVLDSTNEYCTEYGLPGESCVTTDAVDWFTENLFSHSHGAKNRDFVFMHKPPQEFMNLANLYEISGHKQQAIGCQALNTGLFSAALETERVVWINAGFDANNDFSGRYNKKMMFSYARKSGYGGEGDLPRGVRAFRLTHESGNGDKIRGYSYITEGDTGEASTDMHKHSPPNFGFSRQTQCGVDSFSETFDMLLNPEDLLTQ